MQLVVGLLLDEVGGGLMSLMLAKRSRTSGMTASISESASICRSEPSSVALSSASVYWMPVVVVIVERLVR